MFRLQPDSSSVNLYKCQEPHKTLDYPFPLARPFSVLFPTASPAPSHRKVSVVCSHPLCHGFHEVTPACLTPPETYSECMELPEYMLNKNPSSSLPCLPSWACKGQGLMQAPPSTPGSRSQRTPGFQRSWVQGMGNLWAMVAIAATLDLLVHPHTHKSLAG